MCFPSAAVMVAVIGLPNKINLLKLSRGRQHETLQQKNISSNEKIFPPHHCLNTIKQKTIMNLSKQTVDIANENSYASRDYLVFCHLMQTYGVIILTSVTAEMILCL